MNKESIEYWINRTGALRAECERLSHRGRVLEAALREVTDWLATGDMAGRAHIADRVNRLLGRREPEPGQ
jgi:hypothetical protein